MPVPYSHLVDTRQVAWLLGIGVVLGAIGLPLQQRATAETAQVLAAVTHTGTAEQWRTIELLPGVRPRIEYSATSRVGKNLDQNDMQRSAPSTLWGQSVERWRWLPVVYYDANSVLPRASVQSDGFGGVEAVLRDSADGSVCRLAKQKVRGLEMLRGIRRYVQCQNGVVYVVADFSDS